ncbi:FadR family transcriptional regulator [Affinibrenneria salicis]|uniref:FadR family transcriptional regulator n=1 Tax=Affinibrenneria salicis TaxID=2590031 RepID=A0A5J5FYH1_9GAMM|nr:FadR/GntR family transcriptional regulator [Affinibrenneria salicis]KAA8999272.1 FadR family transcriptional regulator [Affinibrenneria salicis]
MELPQLKVERLYRQISNLLIGCIQRGQFPPGTMLPPERELAKQLGVSRSSIREALIALEINGWVEIRTGNGVFVCQPQQQEAESSVSDEFSLKSLIKARQIFEAMAAELAARNATDDQRAELQEITQDLIQLNVNDEKFLREDKRFHLMISEMTGNEVLRDMMEYLWNKRKSSRFVRLESHYAQTHFPLEMNRDHENIAQAIIDRDPQLARQYMELHLQHVYDRLFIEK